MFKPTTAKTPEEYISLISEPRRSEIKTLHSLIKNSVPKLKISMYQSIIGYGPCHYKGKSTEGDWFKIGLASQKNYISVYLCAVDGNQYLAEKNKAKFPKASIGKSCIRFKKLEDINLDLLKELILKNAQLMEKL